MRNPGVNDNEPQPLDPVALTLAVWLGLAVSVAGLARLDADLPALDAGLDATMPMGFAI